MAQRNYEVSCDNCLLWMKNNAGEKICKRKVGKGYVNETFGKNIEELKGCDFGLPTNASQARIMAYYTLYA